MLLAKQCLVWVCFSHIMYPGICTARSFDYMTLLQLEASESLSREVLVVDWLLTRQHDLQDDQLLKSSVGFYRLVAAWMLRLASPGCASTGQPQLPLPSPAPLDFTLLPVTMPCQALSLHACFECHVTGSGNQLREIPDAIRLPASLSEHRTCEGDWLRVL
jgi:hypothetical protein